MAGGRCASGWRKRRDRDAADRRSPRPAQGHEPAVQGLPAPSGVPSDRGIATSLGVRAGALDHFSAGLHLPARTLAVNRGGLCDCYPILFTPSSCKVLIATAAAPAMGA